MNLRCGRQIGASKVDIASKISTQGSGTRSVVGNLECIAEFSSSDTHSDSFYSSEIDINSDQEMSRDIQENWERKGKGPMNPFNDPVGDGRDGL